MKFNTKLIHGNLKTDETGATNTPLHLSNAFAHNAAEKLEKVINLNTKIVFGETLGNPKLDVLDIEEVAKVCNKHNIIFIVDSTITTPFIIRPIEYGADIVIHSTSKYINGTSNSIGGIIVDGGSSKYKDIKYKNFSE